MEHSAIEFEVTERAIIKNMDLAIGMLQKLRQGGFNVSVDDFGTLCSSFRYLIMLPINVIKIDREFVLDLPNDTDAGTVARAIVSIAHDMGAKVVAEEMETATQLDFLQKIGCDQIQGYIFSRPIPSSELAGMIYCDKDSKQKSLKPYNKDFIEIVPFTLFCYVDNICSDSDARIY